MRFRGALADSYASAVALVLLAFATLFMVGSVLAAWAPTPGLFVAGHVTWLGVGIALGGMLVAGAIVLAGRPPLRRPDLAGWLEGKRPAVDSQPLFGRARR